MKLELRALSAANPGAKAGGTSSPSYAPHGLKLLGQPLLGDGGAQS